MPFIILKATSDMLNSSVLHFKAWKSYRCKSPDLNIKIETDLVEKFCLQYANPYLLMLMVQMSEQSDNC